MPKANQTPSKAKSPTKAEAKPKIMKPKSKKNAKSSREPTPTPAPSLLISSTIPTSSSPIPIVHVVPIITTSTVSPPPKTTTHEPELPAKNTSKSTKVKATPRKSVKKVHDVATYGNTVARESVVQGKSVPATTDQVQYPSSKLHVLVSAIDTTPLDTLPPMSEKAQVEKFTVEKDDGDLGKEVDATAVEPVVKGGGSKEHVQKEASYGLSFSWTEDEKDDRGEKEVKVVNIHEEHDAQNIVNEEEKSENEGASGDEKESDTDDKIEEEVSESEGEDQEKVSGSEGDDKESEEEEGNVSEKSEGSMTIESIIIAPSEETTEETRAQEPRSLITHFTGDEEVSSDEDDVPLSEVGKKSKKTPMKSMKTPLTRSKRKVVDAQIIKESRSAKKPKKKVSIVEPVVEVDGENESDSALQAKSATPNRKGVKVTRPATSPTRVSRGKTRKIVLAAVDQLTEFRNRKVLNGKILANTDEKGMPQLLEKLEL
uniref:Neurofilament heavy polypeptide-like n=1 Tax=Nicotiana tabacum TaxID=4097 RepID=A0A1S3ZGD4_TOBAC|nr:PREDICTED: neurofilament heavy polypeptide-like [Nicotiana tabacum]